jgi:hypothetical protein
VSEPHDHGKNLTEICVVGLTAKSLILRGWDILTRHNPSPSVDFNGSPAESSSCYCPVPIRLSTMGSEHWWSGKGLHSG